MIPTQAVSALSWPRKTLIEVESSASRYLSKRLNISDMKAVVTSKRSSRGFPSEVLVLAVSSLFLSTWNRSTYICHKAIRNASFDFAEFALVDSGTGGISFWFDGQFRDSNENRGK